MDATAQGFRAPASKSSRGHRGEHFLWSFIQLVMLKDKITTAKYRQYDASHCYRFSPAASVQAYR